MKKFKLFALAVFAMLSTNAFATPGDYDANTVFRFKIITDYVTASSTLGTAQITGFVADYTDVATTKIPATINGASLGGKYKVVSIAANAFKGKAITKIDLSAAENLTEIGAGALSGTGITSLDLSATKVAVLNQLFETTNKKVKSVKLPKTLTTIGANAFNGLSALTKITFAEQTAPATYGLTIEGFAFKNTMALTTLTLPANVSYIAANAFAKTYLTTLTINGTMPAYAAAVAYADVAEYNAAKGTALTATEFAALSDAEKMKPATGVADGAFVKNGTQTLTVTYKPAKVGTVYVNPFSTTTKKSICFSTSEAAADVYVTLSTSTEYGKFITGEITKFCGVKVDFTPAENAKITVYNHGGTYSYGKFTAPANGITIAKKQGDANVMVYGAYTDDTNPVAVLMEQMHLIQGSYYLPEGTKFIVKSSSDAKVEYTTGVKLNGTGADQDSRNYGAGGTVDRNEIKEYPGPDDYAVAVTPADPTKKDYIIFLKPLDETAFGWAEFADNRVIKEGQFYLEAKAPAAAAGIRVIWLDGSEEDQVTAIKTVKGAKAENGAIYNLAGQKVNAAYKGVVIKDGKKYIQK